MPTRLAREQEFLHALCELTLNPAKADRAIHLSATLNAKEREDLLSVANSNHVIIRALSPILTSDQAGDDLRLWAAKLVAAERDRIAHALTRLEEICNTLELNGCPTTVMKSLDHWPDMGNDLDLYSSATAEQLAKVLTEKFNARVEARSWGDRLANKWNFSIPGLPELVEVHAQRLGQTGEHIRLAKRFIQRRVTVVFEGKIFKVPAPEERVLVATLQRMYRHFYLRVCDIANSAAIVESGALDFEELKRASTEAGIWPGVATYLMIVSDFMKKYRGTGLQMPSLVERSAAFGSEKITAHDGFLRVPRVPQGASLYGRQLTQTAFSGNVPATFRLSLLPPLATAAALAYSITGSDKGVW